MRPALNVFFAIGRYFIPYFTVSLTSLLDTNQDLELSIYLIYDFQEVELLDRTVQFAKEKYGVEIKLIYQDSAIFKNYRVSEHVSINTYLRLLLTEIIPGDVDTGLFLDSDTVVTGSLKALTDIRFAAIDDARATESEKFLYAVSEIAEQRSANSQRLSAMGYPTDHYFNAGIMLVSLKNWRLTGTADQLMELADKYMEELVFWDQDILNMYFVNRWAELDASYNALHLIWKRRKTPLIVHFAGASKPWNYLDRHPYRSYYFKYLRLTPFAEEKYTDFELKKMPLKYLRDFRHFLNYFRQLILGNLKQFQ